MEMYLSLLLLFSLLLPTFLLFFRLRRSPPPSAKSPNSPDTLKSYPLVGNLPHLIRNGHNLFDWSTELLQASSAATVVVAPLVFTADPANVEHISKSHFPDYDRVKAFNSPLQDFFGHGILNVNGEQWRMQRKVASFEFSTKSIRLFMFDQVHGELIERLLPLLTEASMSGEVLDLQDVLARFAFDSICRLAFDMDPHCLGNEKSELGEIFFQAFDEATHLSINRIEQRPFSWMWKLEKCLGVGAERRLHKSIAVVHGIVENAVKSRRRGERGSDFLSRFSADSVQHSDVFLRDIVINFLLAGRDTTPSALTWFFWVLSSNPDVISKIRQELKSIRARRDSHDDDAEMVFITLEELREMNYLHAAIAESMRLYPPVPLVPKESQNEDELPDGTMVRKGWVVMYNSLVMGRSERLWGPDCGEFKPERWLDEAGVFQQKSQAVYPAFHLGPRMCLGKDMAYIQMKAVAASILERFDLDVVEERGKHQLMLTMKMAGGLPVRVKERSWPL